MTDSDDRYQTPSAAWRSSWALVMVLIVAMLLLCMALVLTAAYQG